MKQKTNKKQKIGVRWVFFGYSIILVVFMLALVWLLRLAFVDNTYKQVRIAIAEKTTKEITEVISKGGNFDNIASNVIANSDTSVFLLDGKGFRVASYKGEYNGYVPSNSDFDDAREGALKKLNNQAFSKPLDIGGEDNDKYIIYAQNIKLGNYIEGIGPINSGTGTIVLTCATTPLAPTLKTINFELGIVSVVMVIASFIMAYFLAKHVSKPLIDINNKSKVLAKGNYSVRFNENGYREVGELGKTLNSTTLELGRQDRMRRDLIANVSHDLRTPLTMIKGYAEMMKDFPDENNSDAMDIIIKETDYLTNLVKDMLDISKLDSNKVEFKITEFDINELIISVVARYNALYKQQGFVFKYNDLNREVIVKSDKVMITNVLYNLMNNAVNHIKDDKNIEVKAVIEDSRIIVHVIDHGEGIEESKLGTIWDRYYKAERNLKRESAGSGLGLSIVKTVLTKLNAGYGVKSKVDVGSDFYFDLAILRMSDLYESESADELQDEVNATDKIENCIEKQYTDSEKEDEIKVNIKDNDEDEKK